MRIRLLAVAIAVLSAAAVFQFAPGVNADTTEHNPRSAWQSIGYKAPISDGVQGPTNLQGTHNESCGSGLVSLTWQAPEGSVDHYRVYRVRQEGQPVEADRTTGTSISVAAPRVTGVDRFEVRAYRRINGGADNPDVKGVYVLSAASNATTPVSTPDSVDPCREAKGRWR